jgi:hypothetical protein
MAGCSLFGSSLDPQAQDVVDAVDARTHMSDPGDAARFVSDDLDVLLSEGVAGAVDADAMADLFDAALAGDEQAELFGSVVAGVAAEGDIHSEALRPVLAEAATRQLAWIEERVDEYFASDAPPARLRDDYSAIQVFLRETMSDPRAAAHLDQAVDDYAQAETALAPDGGEPRMERLRQIGRLDALTDEAWHDAELAQAGDAAAIDAANAANRDRMTEGRTNSAVWVALDRYESDAAVRASAQGRPFIDASGAIKSEMSPDEVEALRDWADSLAVDGGLTWADVGDIVTGAADVLR